MKKTIVHKLAVSTLALSLMTVACKPAGSRPSAGSARAAKAEEGAAKLYAKAQEAVQKGELAEALGLAERAVELSPRDTGYRMLLADLYLKNGRFVSADNAYSDVLTLDPANLRAGLTRALSLVAQGKTGEAALEIERFSAIAAPADAGLAFALAGHSARALEMLEPAARAPGATARVRQNLALAYALAGDWQKARTVAAQDLSPSELGSRLQQWAALSNPAAPYTQVAALFNVTPVADAGQPIRLALAPAAPEPVELAAAEAPAPEPKPEPVAAPAAAPAPAPKPPVELAAAAPDPVAVAVPIAAPAVPPAPAPIMIAAAAPALAPIAPLAAAVAKPLVDAVVAVVSAPRPAPLAAPAPAPVGEVERTAVAAPADHPISVAPAEPAVAFVTKTLSEALHFASLPEAEAQAVEVPAQAAPVRRPRQEEIAGDKFAAAVKALVERPAPVRRAAAVAPSPIRAFRPKLRNFSSPSRGPGRYVVQIGAFRSAAQVETAWAEAYRRYGFGDRAPLSTTVTVAGKGTFHRLAVAGFEAPADANRACRTIRAKGGSCFVRAAAGDAPVQWASRYVLRTRKA